MRRYALSLSLLVSIAVVSVGSWAIGSAMIQARPSPVRPAALPSRDVRIATRDGLVIAATYTPGQQDRSSAVLLLHGTGSSRQAMVRNAAWLASLGYATLTIDLRGHGQSDPASNSFGFFESRDAHAAFAWLKSRQGGAPVAVIGISLGGAASLIGEMGPLPAEALILQGVYPDIRHAIRNRLARRMPRPLSAVLEPLLSFQTGPRLGVWPSELSPLNALAGVRGSVLVIGGERDRSTLPAESREMFEAVRSRGELWLVPGSDHAAITNLDSPEYRARIIAFLEDADVALHLRKTELESAPTAVLPRKRHDRLFRRHRKNQTLQRRRA